MASDEFKAKLYARVAELSVLVNEHGLRVESALEKMMEDTVYTCMEELKKIDAVDSYLRPPISSGIRAISLV